MRTGKFRRVWRTARSVFGGLPLVGIIFLLLVPLHGRAQEDLKRHFEERDEEQRGVHREIANLVSKIETLEATVSSLRSKVSSLETQLTVVRSNPALALGPFVSVDPNPQIGVIGPNITFSGANIHIVSGSQATDDHGNPTGLGNLIIGYDEDPGLPVDGDSNLFGAPIMQLPGSPSPLRSGDRGGSHNLVIGAGNKFTQDANGGLVVGERNTIAGTGASVSGGFVNSAAGAFSSVSAGVRNEASGTFSSVSGGGINFAGTSGDSVSGGIFNEANGGYSSVSGGYSKSATDMFSTSP